MLEPTEGQIDFLGYVYLRSLFHTKDTPSLHIGISQAAEDLIAKGLLHRSSTNFIMVSISSLGVELLLKSKHQQVMQNIMWASFSMPMRCKAVQKMLRKLPTEYFPMYLTYDHPEVRVLAQEAMELRNGTN